MTGELGKAFNSFVDGYDAADIKIRLKIAHSYRVADLSRRIARDTGRADEELAWRIGLLHDIGRFEQIRRYHTFVDARSVDHAGLGADMLFGEGLLDRLMPTRVPGDERRLMEVSIRSHSAYRLPEDLTPRERMYCDILRDADKLDIFRVHCETSAEEIYDVTTQELRGSRVSEEVKDCFRKRTAVLRSLKKTAVDFLVAHICLTFELVFPVSRQIARDQGYVDRMLAFESRDPDTAAWFDYMREHIWA